MPDNPEGTPQSNPGPEHGYVFTPEQQEMVRVGIRPDLVAKLFNVALPPSGKTPDTLTPPPAAAPRPSYRPMQNFDNPQDKYPVKGRKRQERRFFSRHKVTAILLTSFAAYAALAGTALHIANNVHVSPIEWNNKQGAADLNTFDTINPQYPVESKPTVSVNGFLAVLHENNSPISDRTAKLIYNMLVGQNVDPGYALAIMQEETQFGKGGIGKSADNLLGMRKWDDIAQDIQNSDGKLGITPDGQFADFSGYGNTPTADNDYEDGFYHGVEAWMDAVTNLVAQGNTTAAQLITTMSPPVENPTSQYITDVENNMQYYNKLSGEIAGKQTIIKGKYVTIAASSSPFRSKIQIDVPRTTT